MADKGTPSQGNDHMLFVGTGILFTLMGAKKIWQWLLESQGHRLLFSTFIGFICSGFGFWLIKKREKYTEVREQEKRILGPSDGAVFCGITKEGEKVFIKPPQRAMHTQVVGTTNAGKTESVILPWAIQDIEQGRGLLLIDGKADRSLLEKLWAYTVKVGRHKDFRLFSLSNIGESQTFNPLTGGTPEEITERIFNAFDFENSFYRSVQYEVLAQVLRLFTAAKEIPTFLKLHQAITDPDVLSELADKANDPLLTNWVQYFRSLSGTEREQRTAGLSSQISHFAFGSASVLFNQEMASITIDEALKNNQIVYFQLPALLSPFLGKATGKLVLQSLQTAVANRHRGHDKNMKFFSVFLDDFAEYLYPGFVTILNKSRSAKVGVVFAHQALGDIKSLGEAIENAILTNSNLKIFMRGSDPDSSEYFSKVVGTLTTTKRTERRKKGFLREEQTGDISAREVEEFIIHPNYFKREMGVGQAVMVIPHDAGSKAIQIKFERFPDLPVIPLPTQSHQQPSLFTQIKSAAHPVDSKNTQTPDETVLGLVRKKDSA